MELYFSKRIKLSLTVLLAAVILLLSMALGIGNGRDQARAAQVISDAENLLIGLKFFYQDQGRLPTALEFQNRNIMLNYFNRYPPEIYAGGGCSRNFEYKRVSREALQLSVCLPADRDNYHKGWNVLNKRIGE